jgi:hypothetical protein
MMQLNVTAKSREGSTLNVKSPSGPQQRRTHFNVEGLESGTTGDKVLTTNLRIRMLGKCNKTLRAARAIERITSIAACWARKALPGRFASGDTNTTNTASNNTNVTMRWSL